MTREELVARQKSVEADLKVLFDAIPARQQQELLPRLRRLVKVARQGPAALYLMFRLLAVIKEKAGSTEGFEAEVELLRNLTK